MTACTRAARTSMTYWSWFWSTTWRWSDRLPCRTIACPLLWWVSSRKGLLSVSIRRVKCLIFLTESYLTNKWRRSKRGKNLRSLRLSWKSSKNCKNWSNWRRCLKKHSKKGGLKSWERQCSSKNVILWFPAKMEFKMQIAMLLLKNSVMKQWKPCWNLTDFKRKNQSLLIKNLRLKIKTIERDQGW